MSQASGGESSLYKSDIDNERLAFMAQTGLDDITMRILQEDLWIGPDSRVLDCGVGPSPLLGQRITAQYAEYFGVDTNWAAILPQLEVGHTVFRSDVQHVPSEIDNITHFNARCCFSWLTPQERENAWNELFRVGRPNLRGVVTEPDWTVVNGPPLLMELAHVLTDTMSVMPGSKFESGYGAYLEQDMDQKLRARVGEGNYFIQSSREPMPAPTPEHKQKTIEFAAGNIIRALRGAVADPKSNLTIEQKNDMTVRADRLQQLLEQFLAAHFDPSSIRLPDMVSVRFGVLPPRLHIGSVILKGASLAFPLNEQPPDGSVVLQMFPPWDEVPLGQEARRLSIRAYTLAGHFLRREEWPVDMTQADFEYDVDRPEERQRSVQLLVVDPHARPIFGVQVQFPTAEGIMSLPTGKEFVEKYSLDVLPEFLRNAKVAEMKRLWGRKFRLSYLETSILPGIQVADEAGMEYMLYGAVEQDVHPELRNAFGEDVMQSILVDNEPANVLITGETRAHEGTKLLVGYAKIDGFYLRAKKRLEERARELELNLRLNVERSHQLEFAQQLRNARYMIKLCDSLEARRAQHIA